MNRPRTTSKTCIRSQDDDDAVTDHASATDAGSALLIVLVILAIALPIGVGFSYYVIAARATSESYLHRVRAQQVCESGLSHVMAVLQWRYDPDDGVNDVHDLFPATVPTDGFAGPAVGEFSGRYYLCSGTADNNDIASELHVTMAGLDFLSDSALDMSDPGAPVADDRGFIHITSDSEVIGRFAFMVIDESGKWDPGAVAATYGIGSEATGSVVRSGASDSEVCMQDVGIADFDTYKPDAGKQWHSHRQLARELQPVDFKNKVIQNLFPYSYHTETFWSDTDNDGIFTDSEEYNRLDLQDAAAITLDNLYKMFVAPDDTDVAMPAIGDLVDDNDCAWIKNLAADGVLASGADRRRAAAQTAAAIVDYVDSDSDATIVWIDTQGQVTTSDPGAANTEIRVVGRENQFGLSEISLRLDTTVVNAGGGNNHLRADLYLKGEVYYPGVENVPIGAHSLTVSFTVTIASTAGGSKTFFDAASYTMSLAASSNIDGGTMHYSSAWELAGSHTEAAFVGTIPVLTNTYQITNCEITSVVLHDGGTAIDSFPSQPFNTHWWNWNSLPLQMGDLTYYATLEALDPLNNECDEAGPIPSYSTVWRDSPAGSAKLSYLGAAVGIGALTTLAGGNTSISEYSDIEVRNAVFDRVGELGRVGSYMPGRSLRFWAADAGDSAGVDAAILDLFRVGSDTPARGRVNINTVNSDVLTGLFTNAATVPVADAVAAILAARTTVTFSNMGDVFAVEGVSGTDVTSDKVEEAMVQLIAELITVRWNFFTAVVIGQSVFDYGDQYFYRDLNGDGDTLDAGEVVTTTLGIYDHDGDQILATVKLLAVLRRDAYRNTFKIESIELINY